MVDAYAVYHVHCEQVTMVFDGKCDGCGALQDEHDFDAAGDPIIRGTIVEVWESGAPVCQECGDDLELHEMVEIEEI